MHKSLFELLLSDDIRDETKLQLLIETEKYTSDENALYELVCYVKKTQTFPLSHNNALDIVGTGWSLLQRINVSTISSFILAKMGIPITKHGSNASTGRVWSFDLLAHFKHPIPKDAQTVAQLLQDKKPAFLYARLLFPIMKSVSEVRKQYGKPTLFNFLWPLLSPADPDFQLIGCAFEDKMELIARVAGRLGRKRVCVVKWSDGLDDITLTGQSTVVMFSHNKISHHIITPEMFGIEQCSFVDIQWGDVEQNGKIALSILDGTCKSRHRDLVAINCALALFIYYEKIDLSHPQAHNKIKKFYQLVIKTISWL
jgi:anthranilate phosphoribosyltransferase